jgi:hypothetical protein
MTTFSNLPGTLNIEVAAGDTLSVDIDFDRALTGYTVDARLLSVVSLGVVLPLTATITSEANGIVTVSLTATQTAALPIGTYAWELSWEAPQSVKRKVMAGYFEVKHR